MKFLIIFAFLISIISCGGAQQSNVQAQDNIATISRGSTKTTTTPSLGKEIETLYKLIYTKPLQQLLRKYLLNDAQFQAFVRVINSPDVYLVGERFRTQPEVIAFISWIRYQLLLSGDSEEDLSLEDSNESLNIFNPTPYWAFNNVNGWQGFINEFNAIYPSAFIQYHIRSRVAENGTFAEFWRRLEGLKVVYERILALPETQRVIAQLEALGINTKQIDDFIRNLFGWRSNVDAVAQNTAQIIQANNINNANPIDNEIDIN